MRRGATVWIGAALLLATVLPGTAHATAAACPSGVIVAATFRDVAPGNPHRAAIDCMVHWGVTRGSSPGRYAPAGVVSRAQMASFLVAALERAGAVFPAAGDAFTDDRGNPHEASIDKLAAVGIVTGTGGARYRPRAAVGRGAMATFLVRAYEVSTGRGLPSAGDAFPDDTGHPHEASIDKAAAAGFAGGTGTGFAPDRPVTRDQMATFLARLLDRLVREGFTRVPPAAAPLPQPGSGPVPREATYSIEITGVAGSGIGTPFAIGGTLVITPTLDPAAASGNGVNPVDVGIATSPSPLVGVAGALWFGTNTTISALLGSSPAVAASAVDVAFVRVDDAAGTVEAEIDGDVFGLPTARINYLNIYNVSTSITAQIHNVLAGRVTVTVSDGGRRVSGTIDLGGTSGFGGPAISSGYQATFQGTRTR